MPTSLTDESFRKPEKYRSHWSRLPHSRDHIRQTPDSFQTLRPCLPADDGLNCRTSSETDGVRRPYQTDRTYLPHCRPVPKGLIDRVFECTRAAGNRNHFRAEQFHLMDVDILSGHVDTAHKNLRLHPEQRPDHGGCQSMLTGTGLGDKFSCPYIWPASPVRGRCWSYGPRRAKGLALSHTAKPVCSLNCSPWYSGVGRPA